VARLMLAEAGFLGLIASVVGLFSGIGLALVLTFVINRVFFGWTIDLSFPWRELAVLPFWMTGTALVAGVHSGSPGVRSGSSCRTSDGMRRKTPEKRRFQAAVTLKKGRKRKI